MQNYTECPSCHQKQLESKSDYCSFCYASFKDNKTISENTNNSLLTKDNIANSKLESIKNNKSADIFIKISETKDNLFKKNANNKFELSKGQQIFVSCLVLNIFFMILVSVNVISGDLLRFFILSFINDVVLITLFLYNFIFYGKKLKLNPYIIIISIIFINPLLVLSMNYVFSSSVQSYKVTVLSKYTTHGKSGTSCWVEITSWKKDKETIKVDSSTWDSIEDGSKHIIKIRRGGLGIDTFYNFY